MQVLVGNGVVMQEKTLEDGRHTGEVKKNPYFGEGADPGYPDLTQLVTSAFALMVKNLGGVVEGFLPN